MRSAGPILVSALLLSAPAARAQSADPPAAEAASEGQRRADEMIREGVALRKAGKEAEALERFKQANAVHPSARALGQMGLAAKSMRFYIDAERYLEAALAAADDEWVKQNREALELARDVVARQLAWLMVSSNVDGAELLVNGGVVGRLPLDKPVRVPAGTVLVELRSAGFEASVSETTVSTGSTADIRIELVAARPDAPAPPPRAPPTPPAETPTSRRPYAYVAAGVGVVGLGVGATFGILTLSKKADRDEVCPVNPCKTESGRALDGEARTLATWSTVGFVVGGIGLATAAILHFTEPKAKKAARASTLGGWSF